MKIYSTWLMVLIMTLSQSAIAATFKTEKWKTTTGVQVVFYPAMEVPMLDISLAFAAGSAYDEDVYGLSTLTSHMLDQGNDSQNATAVAESLADTGAQFNIESNRDMVVLSLRTLVNEKELTQSTKTFAQIINHPDFPNDAFSREKKQLLMAIKQAGESPEETAELHFFDALYQQHPYAHRSTGTPKTLSAINKNQLINFYHRYYVANNAVLVIVGAVNSETAHKLAEKLTQDLPKGEPTPPVVKAAPLTKAKQINIPFPSSQTIMYLGQLGIDYKNPDYFPLVVGNYILGGGSLVSRLAIEVREKRGLTYSVNSQFTPMPGLGPFLITLSTENKQAKQALEIVQKVLRTYIEKGPDVQELTAAKQYLTGSFPLSLASNRTIATLLIRMNFYHLPDDYLDTYIAHINAVNKEDIKRAFKQQLNPDKLLRVTVGPS